MKATDTQIGGNHYKKFKIQPVEFIVKNELGYIEGNVIKYICRHKEKGGKEDLLKAKHYIDLLIQLEYEKGGEVEKECKKIAIIGSTKYYDQMTSYAIGLEHEGYCVRLPKFDFDDLSELEICEKNREMIEWADEVHIFWDRRSLGTIFDFGMAFALRKPIKIVYLEPKTFENLMRQYEEVTK